MLTEHLVQPAQGPGRRVSGNELSWSFSSSGKGRAVGTHTRHTVQVVVSAPKGAELRRGGAVSGKVA